MLRSEMLSLNTLVILLLVVGVLSALVLGFSWAFARLYCRPKRRPPAKTPAHYDLPFEAVTFHSHGVPLRGWFIPSKGNPAPPPTVILAHSWSYNAGQMLPLARALHLAGFAVLLYNARGHGDSGKDGPITILKFAEDLIAAVDYLMGRSDVDAARLGAVGHSLGASAAIVAASTEPRLRAVVSSAAFADPETLTADFLRALHVPRWPFLWLICRFIERWLGARMREVAPRNRIGQIHAPLLLIHGESDRFIPSSNMSILSERARREQVENWLVAGRGHSDVIRHPDFDSRVVGFLKKHL